MCYFVTVPCTSEGGVAPPFASRLSKELSVFGGVKTFLSDGSDATRRASLSNCSCNFTAKAMSDSSLPWPNAPCLPAEWPGELPCAPFSSGAKGTAPFWTDKDRINASSCLIHCSATFELDARSSSTLPLLKAIANSPSLRAELGSRSNAVMFKSGIRFSKEPFHICTNMYAMS